ncbi:MAG: hypothetical protein J2P28_02940 [Actinobacteria bacterium]|nr:hypothetical protein [Actinomycetota bacterium]MBO0834460.1 hypothetical protein [Actinomycetota bacterium]
MRFIDRLSMPQRVVIVIALGLALGALDSYLVSLGGPFPRGWFAYAPLQPPQIGMAPWLRLVIFLVLIALWLLASIRVLRPSGKSGSD